MFFKRPAGRAVVRSTEFNRVLGLPRRRAFDALTQAEKDHLADLLTAHFRVPGSGTPPAGKGIPERLFPVQAFALCELVNARGLMAIVPTGGGKTLVSLLGFTALDAKRPLLITRAQLRDKTKHVSRLLSEYWRIPLPLEEGGSLRLLSYESLSREKQAEVLWDWAPDVVLCDEAHRLAHKGSGVTRRVVRYRDEFPRDKVVMGFMTASAARKGPREYAHLVDMALAEGSPLPRTFSEIEDWHGALVSTRDDDENVVHPGALALLCVPGETVREGYGRRLAETPGVVVMSRQDDIGCSLTIEEVPAPDPVPAVVDAFRLLREKWQLPSGEQLMEQLEFENHALEIALGFYYRYVWLNGQKDEEWLWYRKAWRQFVRHIIRYGAGGKHFDTELQVWNAVAKGVIKDQRPQSDNCPEPLRHVKTPWESWRAVKDRCDPPTEVVWLDDFAVRFAEKWLAHGSHGILWVGHRALLDALEPIVGRDRIFRGGDDHIIHETGDVNIVASLHAHREGKDLQRGFHRNMVLCSPPGGQAWEQLIGRTFRTGQPADEVTVQMPFLCYEQWRAFETAQADALGTRHREGIDQKLLFADVVLETTADEVRRRGEARNPLWRRDW